jgi:hypothetical protein
MRRATLRPSNTDKLDPEFGCEWFATDSSGDKTFLNRGNDMDGIYRRVLQDENVSQDEVSPEDYGKVLWAAEETCDIAGGYFVTSAKDQCKVVIPGFHNPGEVDAECPGQLCSFDVKSGQEYRYYNQQACYAYGQMLKHFASTWTVWVLYMDLHKRVRYSYSLLEAQTLVERIVDQYNAPGEPKVGQFCSWCANFKECPAQRQLVDNAMGHLTPTFNFSVLEDDPVKLGQFLELMQPICKEKGWFDKAKALAKERLLQKIEVPGWKLQSRAGNKYVNVTDVLLNFPENAIPYVLKKTITESEYMDMCEKHNVKPDTTIIKQAGDSIFPAQDRKKK